MKLYTVAINYTEAFSPSAQTKIFELVAAESAFDAEILAEKMFKAERGGVPCRDVSTTVIRHGAVPAFEEGKVYDTNDGQSWRVAARYFDLAGVPQLVIENLKNRNTKISSVTAFRREREPKTTIEFWTVYPNGNVYSAARRVQNSSFERRQLVEIKVTKRNGVIIEKEIL